MTCARGTCTGKVNNVRVCLGTLRARNGAVPTPRRSSSESDTAVSEQQSPEQTPQAPEVPVTPAEQLAEPQAEQATPQEQAVPEPVAAEDASSGSAPAPAPVVPAPVKPAAPRPMPTPAAARVTAKPAQASPAPAAPSTSLEEARKFARVTEDGHVFVIVDGAEQPVGQYPDKTPDEALAYFVRKYDDLVAQVALLEQRVVAKAPAGDMPKTLDTLEAQVKERKVVGDIPALEARVETLRVAVDLLRTEERRNADQLREKSLAAREAIVAEAEELSGRPPAQVQWKQASTRMAELFELWKVEQKSGHRIGRSTEDALWKRFRAARTVFDRHRRTFFSKLDTDNAEAKGQKEALIARAEALQTSTDWGDTAREYRRLMDEWKASKRASRRDDDALWTRFRAAQDVFFEARKAANDEIDAEFGANLVVKEALLTEARALMPVKDLASAQRALNSIRDRWEAAGKVPRGDLQRVEAGLRQVEDAVKSAEDEQWRRSNPETKARSNSMLAQLEDAIADLEADLAKAQAKGDARQISKAQDALDARRQWLETVRRSASDLG
ncbi:DUF349 domain-containing protein [Galactobacter caseinivorans]|uniref:DUF349 domain-containing protein n=1 Tax=Galactobacter caseinivorans TaxID=2676123 RepID=A0A496PLA6_9MICC|nr:DUF349 domain-containing protein [Galactobacter caseinivorans]